MSARRVIGPIFYDDRNTVNTIRYVNNMPSPFFAELTEEEMLYEVTVFSSKILQQLIRLMQVWKHCDRFSMAA
jgi:hypothetical protein